MNRTSPARNEMSVDHRERPCRPAAAVMIDDPDSRDLDDAITVRSTPSGWTATVHIAAAADAIAADSPTDHRARASIETTYLPHKTTPMLGNLERAATLSAGQPRSALSVSATFDTAGTCTTTELTRTHLPAGTCIRLPYSRVPKVLADTSHPLHQQLTAAHQLADTLLAARRAAGALAVYDLNHGFAISEEGAITYIPQQQRNAGYVIVQELMIAANNAIASWCIDRDLPILFRNHRTNLTSTNGADLTADIAASLHDPELFDHLRERINRTMGKATYASTPRGHHGLRLMAYTHATSPLRRYADLATQRIILDYLDGRPSPYTLAELEDIANHINTTTARRRLDRDDHFKQQRRKEAAAHILDGTYQNLDPKQWRKMFDLMTKIAPTQGIEAELHRRLDEELLLPNDVARLATAGPAWQSIQRRLYPKIQAAHPEFGPSAINGWRQIIGHTAPIEIDETRDPSRPTHQPLFAARARTGDLIGRWQTGKSKKTAQADAMWDLLAVIGGHSPSGSTGDEPPAWEPAPTTAPAATTDTNSAATVTPTPTFAALSDSLRTHLAGISGKKRSNALSNPVGWLASLSMTHNLGDVDYHYQSEGPAHAITFTCTATIAGHTSTNTATAKNAARVGAATALVEALIAGTGTIASQTDNLR